MSVNIIDQFNNATGDILVRETSGWLAESSQNIASAVDSIVPSVLGSLLLKSTTDTGAKDVRDFISANGLEEAEINESSFLDTGNETEGLMAKGSTILKYLFGDQLVSVVDMIAGNSGLKTSSANSLLRIVSPLLIGHIGRMAQEEGMRTGDFRQLLQSQREDVLRRTPQGIRELLGFQNLTGQDITSPGKSFETNVSEKNQNSGLSKILPWIVLLLASLGLFYFLQKGCHSNPPVEAEGSTAVVEKQRNTNISPAPAGMQSAPPVPGTEKLHTYSLPDGSKLNAEPNTFTARMVDYLNGTGKAGQCIPFDEVNFDVATNKLMPESESQLYQFILILNAYPQVTFSLNSYVDTEGDAGYERDRSNERGAAVMDWFMQHGIKIDRMQMKALGNTNPIAPKDTEEGRKKNSRVEVCILKK
jgi:outer membrane protein OmpA-like peptidoglycan-associated protein